jgi:electron transfer flavoprotein beta subunit
LNIAVCAKAAPNTNTPRIPPSADKSGIDTTGLKYEVQPYDLFAVTKGVELVEQGKAGKVHLFTVGNQEDVAQLRGSALALGAADLVLIEDPKLSNADSLLVAKALAAAIGATPDVGLVLTGVRAVDWDNVQVPAMIAELLGWPLVSAVSDLQIDGSSFTATRNVGGGVQEVVKGQLPAVITCEKGLVQPRYAKLPDIMKAKTKPVAKKTAADLGLADATPAITYTNYAEPPARPKGRILQGDLDTALDELVSLLRTEAKVL